MTDGALESLYGEGAQALRHYSAAILNIRNVAIAQGFAVLTAEAYLMTENQWTLLVGATVFGVCLTVVLCALQWNCKRYFDAMLPAVVALESKSCSGIPGPWTTYHSIKTSPRRWARYRLPTLHGLFFLLMLTQC